MNIRLIEVVDLINQKFIDFKLSLEEHSKTVCETDSTVVKKVCEGSINEKKVFPSLDKFAMLMNGAMLVKANEKHIIINIKHV